MNPDQTPRSAAFDLGLHSLPPSLLWAARHKWVNVATVSGVLPGDVEIVLRAF